MGGEVCMEEVMFNVLPPSPYSNCSTEEEVEGSLTTKLDAECELGNSLVRVLMVPPSLPKETSKCDSKPSSELMVEVA